MLIGRNILVVTRHKKETILKPILEKKLGLNCFLSENFDTDSLGTFSGEIERNNDPVTTARLKCIKALEGTEFDLAIASEGSFGPHPTYYFVPADEEVLLLYDRKYNIEVVSKELSTKTNFAGSCIKNKEELDSFLNNVNFPSHGVILRKSKNDFNEIYKGLNEYENLFALFQNFITKYGEAYIETDMRAMYNPMRMEVIKSSALKLVDKINNKCPNCKYYGFDISEYKRGLPCSLCKFPTKSILSYKYSCQNCKFSEEFLFPNNKQMEDPMFCDICNP